MYKKNISVVMGSVSGIGKEIVRQLLLQGKQVLALDVDEPGLQALKKELSSDFLMTAVCDTTSSEQLQNVLQDLGDKNQRIEEWVQSAGIARIDTFAKMTLEDFLLVQKVNFLGLVTANHLVLKVMERQGFGKILNIGSVSGHVPSPLMTAYSASKHAVVGFTKSLQEELEMTGSAVRIILVSPGFVKTPLLTKNLQVPFPEFLNGALDTAENVASAVITALETCPREVIPSLNGKLMLAAEKFPVSFPFRFLRKKMAQRLTVLLLAGLCIFSVKAAQAQEQPGELYVEKKTPEAKEEAPPALERYQPLIFAVGRPRTKVQFSVKARIIRKYPLYVGYTQTMFWELWEKSKPFYDTTYNPDLFYRWMLGEQKDIEFDFGLIEHLSNGQDEDKTRSVNRTYLRASKEWQYEKYTFRGTAKFAPSYDYDDPNRDFADYVSPWEFQGVLTFFLSPAADKVTLGFRVFPGGKYGQDWNRGGYLLHTSFHIDSIGLVPELYAEYVDSYAESLRNYSEREKTFRLGVRF